MLDQRTKKRVAGLSFDALHNYAQSGILGERRVPRVFFRHGGSSWFTEKISHLLQ
jgi:hypothetical protein